MVDKIEISNRIKLILYTLLKQVLNATICVSVVYYDGYCMTQNADFSEKNSHLKNISICLASKTITINPTFQLIEIKI